MAMRPGGVHRGGRIGLREQDTQRRPYAEFFGYFLVQRQESNIALFYSKFSPQGLWNVEKEDVEKV